MLYIVELETLYSGNACTCTSEYNVRRDGKIVQGYCEQWNSEDPGSVFCYLAGGLSSSNCPGALKSKAGDFYWTKDQTVCSKAKGMLHQRFP